MKGIIYKTHEIEGMYRRGMHMEIGERVCELRKLRGMTQAEMAAKTGISVAQISRIESGETKTMKSDMLILLSKELDVTTDYLLGLTSAKKYYDCSQLGLSEKAARTIIFDVKHKEVLNYFIEDPRFPKWVSLISWHVKQSPDFEKELVDTTAETVYKKCLEMERTKKDPDAIIELENTLAAYRANMEPKTHIVRDKIVLMFDSMLTDIQNKYNHGMKPGERATLDFFKKMIEEMAEHRYRYKNPLRIFQTAFHYLGGALALDKHTGPKFLRVMYLVGVNKIRQLDGKPPLSELPQEMMPGELPQEIKDDLGEPLSEEEADSMFTDRADFEEE